MHKIAIILTTLWMMAFIIALSLDSAVATYLHDTGIARFVEGKWWAQVIKEPGEFAFTVAVAILLLQWRRFLWHQAGFMFLAGVVSGINGIIKWIVGRSRPFKLPGPIQPRPFELHPFWHGPAGFFKQVNLSFPSGHVSTVVALLAAIAMVWPRGTWIFIILAIAVGIERVAENAHYLSDVVGAAGIAAVGVVLLRAVLFDWMKPNINSSAPTTEKLSGAAL